MEVPGFSSKCNKAMPEQAIVCSTILSTDQSEMPRTSRIFLNSTGVMQFNGTFTSADRFLKVISDMPRSKYLGCT